MHHLTILYYFQVVQHRVQDGVWKFSLTGAHLADFMDINASNSDMIGVGAVQNQGENGLKESGRGWEDGKSSLC